MNNSQVNTIQPGRMFPDLEWSKMNGGTTRVSDFRNRMNLILFYPGDGGFGVINRLHSLLSNRQAEFEYENARIIFVIPSGGQTMQTLLDEESRIIWVVFDTSHEADRLHKPMVFLIDRFGELMQRWDAPFEEAKGLVEDVLAELRYLELLCPE